MYLPHQGLLRILQGYGEKVLHISVYCKTYANSALSILWRTTAGMGKGIVQDSSHKMNTKLVAGIIAHPMQYQFLLKYGRVLSEDF